MNTIVTTADLLKQLRPFGIALDGAALTFETDVPDDLWNRVLVLRSGLRSLLSGKRWFCNDEHGRGVGPLEYGCLRHDEPVPLEVVRLAVEGETCAWDKIHPCMKTDFPELFAKTPAAKRRAS